MKLIHTATLPDGRVAKRVTTGRRYSHVIFARETETIRDRQIADLQRAGAKRRAEIADPAAGYARFCREYHMLVTAPEHAARYGTLEAWKAGVEAEIIGIGEDVAKCTTRPLGNWWVHGWSSRLDLAQKAAGAVHGRGYETRVVPVEAVREVVPHAKKAPAADLAEQAADFAASAKVED